MPNGLKRNIPANPLHQLAGRSVIALNLHIASKQRNLPTFFRLNILGSLRIRQRCRKRTQPAINGIVVNISDHSGSSSWFGAVRFLEPEAIRT